jgi:hypothetical protein
MAVHSATASVSECYAANFIYSFISYCMPHGFYNKTLLQFSNVDFLAKSIAQLTQVLFFVLLRSALFSYTSQFLLLLPQEVHFCCYFSTFTLCTTYPNIVCHAVHVIHHSLLWLSKVLIPQYLFTYVLTYSMEQSLSWEVNWFSASQEIPRISWNPKVYYFIHTCPPPVSVLNHIIPFHAPTSHFLKIHLNIILPSTPVSSK